MTPKSLQQWGEEIEVTVLPKTEATMWQCPLCQKTFRVAARDTRSAAVGIARLAFMDHMEADHAELVDATMMTAHRKVAG